MPERQNKILLYFIHPSAHKSRLNSAMIEAVDGMDNITIRKLYDLYPDFYIDVRAEQKQLTMHDIIVWQHPFYWYSAPPLLKEWIDLVLEHGFAFGKEGKALVGKRVLQAITTGGTYEAYTEGGHNHFTVNQLLSPFRATARICNMDYLPPFVIHGTLLIDKQRIEKAAEDYKKILIGLRDNAYPEQEVSSQEYINSLLT